MFSYAGRAAGYDLLRPGREVIQKVFHPLHFSSRVCRQHPGNPFCVAGSLHGSRCERRQIAARNALGARSVRRRREECAGISDPRTLRPARLLRLNRSYSPRQCLGGGQHWGVTSADNHRPEWASIVRGEQGRVLSVLTAPAGCDL
jgi:hypothetical protein